mgnify:CR=1 FL=1
MTSNVEIVKAAYDTAEVLDIDGFVDLFAEDGYLWDLSDGQKYVGKEVGDLVTNFAKSFPDIHRELHDVYESGDDKVIVELTLMGTNNGPMVTSNGTLEPTGEKINVPCCDVWTIKDGKIQSFHCYNAASILLAQIGVL